jgi:hypothetical protein
MMELIYNKKLYLNQFNFIYKGALPLLNPKGALPLSNPALEWDCCIIFVVFGSTFLHFKRRFL